MSFQAKQSGWSKTGNTTKPGNPLWDEYEHPITQEKTLSVFTPKKISSFDTCDHEYALLDDTSCQCTRCGLGHRIVWGIQRLEQGKIVTVPR